MDKLEVQRAHRQRLKESGRCFACGLESRPNRTLCQLCADKMNAGLRSLRHRGICRQCGKPSMPGKLFCEADQEKYRARLRTPEHRLKASAYVKRKRQELRLEVIAHYGGKCACCGESNHYFLTVDHKNEDGCSDHRRLADPSGWYRTIKKLGFPDDLQAMCWNCNIAKHKYGNGVCPHKFTDSLTQLQPA